MNRSMQMRLSIMKNIMRLVVVSSIAALSVNALMMFG